MTNVSPVTPGTTDSTTTSALSQQTGALGEDAFLQLLVTQLQNQDPTQPQDSSAFVTQLAQFTSLEKLTSMNQSLTALSDIDAVLSKIEQQIAGVAGAIPANVQAITQADTSSTTGA